MRDSTPSFIEDVACEEKCKDLLNRYCTFGELTLHVTKVINTKGKHTNKLLQGSAIRSGGKYTQIMKLGIPKEAIDHTIMRDSALTTQESYKAVKINKDENSIYEIVQSAKMHITEEGKKNRGVMLYEFSEKADWKQLTIDEREREFDNLSECIDDIFKIKMTMYDESQIRGNCTRTNRE